MTEYSDLPVSPNNGKRIPNSDSAESGISLTDTDLVKLQEEDDLRQCSFKEFQGYYSVSEGIVENAERIVSDAQLLSNVHVHDSSKGVFEEVSVHHKDNGSSIINLNSGEKDTSHVASETSTRDFGTVTGKVQ